MVFGYYASYIGRAFFPSGSAFVSLTLSLMTFGAGFLMRPLGAIVLGAYTDSTGGGPAFSHISALCHRCNFDRTGAGLRHHWVAWRPLLVLAGRLLQGSPRAWS